MELSHNTQPESTATQPSAEQLAAQIQGLEAVIARYERLLSGAQETNHEWEHIFDAIEDPICVVTADYRLVHANTAYIRLFGAPSDHWGQHYCFVLDGDHTGLPGRYGPCADCPLPDTVRTRRAGFAQQVWRFAGGPGGVAQSKTYQRWTYPIVNADGTVDRVVEVLKDVTEQERMRRTVASTEALREADRLKAELLGTVSHELRSPLTAIKGYAATLLRHERRLPREERHEFLEAIGEASDRLEVIINRLLEMSQLETGSITPHLASVDVAQVVREAIAFAEQHVQASETGRYAFALRTLGRYSSSGRTAPLATPVIDADARLLRDALDNLLENAVKYSPGGGNIEVTIGVCTADDAGGGAGASGEAAAEIEAVHAAGAAPAEMLEIVVRDTGVGIPAEHLGRVFERFHRVDTRLTREVDGLGLGLAMCKRIAELHGGSIWAESAPGEGSAFHLVLPLAASPAMNEAHVSEVGSA